MEASTEAACSSFSLPPPVPAAGHAPPSQHVFKQEERYAPYLYSGNVIGTKALTAGEAPF